MKTFSKFRIFCLILLVASQMAFGQFGDYLDHYVTNQDVRIHYVSRGNGPVLIFLHGFPDFWFTWKHQMDNLSADYKVIGIDLRAYNRSEGPTDAEEYAMINLMQDVLAVMNDLDVANVTLIANDWGGAIAWQLATYYPDRVRSLIACNIPHPQSLAKYLTAKPETGDYAIRLQDKKALMSWDIDRLMEASGATKSPLATIYREAFKRSHVQGMLNYYIASYPKPSSSHAPATISNPTKIKCPVLMIHGLEDKAFPPGTLNDHWLLVENEFALYTIPNAGHFIQREKPEKVLSLIRQWLLSTE